MRTCMDCGYNWKPELEKDSDSCPLCKFNSGMDMIVQNNMKLQAKINQVRRNNEAAMDILQTYGNIEGSDHKMWVIDQTLKALMGDDKYKNFRKELTEIGYSWEEGIAP